MRWFRANRKFGGRLALFALAVQAYLSFGHIHPDDIYGPAKVSLNAAQTIVLPRTEAMRSLPAGSPWFDDDALCPICETMYLLGTSFAPAAPYFPQPVATRAVETIAPVATIAVTARRTPFQSRAPPSV